MSLDAEGNAMIAINKILCPVDLSDGSRHGFDHAVAIARWYGASITILHVFETVPVAAYATGAGSPGDVLTPPERALVLADLERMVAAESGEGVSITIRTAEGHPSAEILNASMEMAPDLLVIGTHGRSGFQRLVLGSVTEKVLRRAPCPVLSVPPRAVADPAPVAYKRILCAVDFSNSSLAALKYATSLATVFASPISVPLPASNCCASSFPSRTNISWPGAGLRTCETLRRRTCVAGPSSVASTTLRSFAALTVW